MSIAKLYSLMTGITLLCFFFSCSSKDNNKETESFQTILIRGRDDGANFTERPYVYRVSIPKDWAFIPPPLTASIADSRLPIAEFHIKEAEGEILIALHNFPPQENNRRIPPMAQISRWKGQFSSLDHTKSSLDPQSFSGYVGFRFEGVGLLRERKTAMIGWALQLAPEHFLTLSYPHEEFTPALLKQMQADVTIKITGAPSLIEKHKQAIDRFARDFELIHEIPSPLL